MVAAGRQIEDAHSRLFAELRQLREENAAMKQSNDSLTGKLQTVFGAVGLNVDVHNATLAPAPAAAQQTQLKPAAIAAQQTQLKPAAGGSAGKAAAAGKPKPSAGGSAVPDLFKGPEQLAAERERGLAGAAPAQPMAADAPVPATDGSQQSEEALLLAQIEAMRSDLTAIRGELTNEITKRQTAESGLSLHILTLSSMEIFLLFSFSTFSSFLGLMEQQTSSSKRSYACVLPLRVPVRIVVL